MIPRLLLLTAPLFAGEIREFPGGAEIPHEKYIHAVSEKVSPVERAYIKSKDGLYVAAAIRKPAGDGPFPVLLHFHGAPGGRGIEQLVGWARGDHGSPVFERFLQDGYVIVIADYRGGQNFQTLADAHPPGAITYVDDALAVLEHVRKQPFVDASRITVYGVSLGGDVTMHLLSRVSVHRAVLGAPAPINFLGARAAANAHPDERFKGASMDAERARAAVARIQTPVLIQVGTADGLIHLCRILHEELEKAGKKVMLEIYEKGYHDFVMGPQGQAGRKEPLLDITMKALESARRWAK